MAVALRTAILLFCLVQLYVIDKAVANTRPTAEDKLEQKLHKALQSAEIRRGVDFNSVVNLHEFNCRMQAENRVIQAHFSAGETDAFKEEIRKYFNDHVARLTDQFKAEVQTYESADDKHALPRKAAQETIKLCQNMEDMAAKKLASKRPQPAKLVSGK